MSRLNPTRATAADQLIIAASVAMTCSPLRHEDLDMWCGVLQGPLADCHGSAMTVASVRVAAEAVVREESYRGRVDALSNLQRAVGEYYQLAAANRLDGYKYACRDGGR